MWLFLVNYNFVQIVQVFLCAYRKLDCTNTYSNGDVLQQYASLQLTNIEECKFYRNTRVQLFSFSPYTLLKSKHVFCCEMPQNKSASFSRLSLPQRKLQWAETMYRATIRLLLANTVTTCSSIFCSYMYTVKYILCKIVPFPRDSHNIIGLKTQHKHSYSPAGTADFLLMTNWSWAGRLSPTQSTWWRLWWICIANGYSWPGVRENKCHLQYLNKETDINELHINGSCWHTNEGVGCLIPGVFDPHLTVALWDLLRMWRRRHC